MGCLDKMIDLLFMDGKSGLRPRTPRLCMSDAKAFEITEHHGHSRGRLAQAPSAMHIHVHTRSRIHTTYRLEGCAT